MRRGRGEGGEREGRGRGEGGEREGRGRGEGGEREGRGTYTKYLKPTTVPYCPNNILIAGSLTVGGIPDT